MGTVYGGLDELRRCVAVKTLHERYASQPEFREAFTREVELLARVEGVCVPRVRAADVEAPVPWMAADFVPGRTLRAHVAELGVLDGPMLHAFAAGTAEALAAIHAAGVVHRDIKPGNVILSPEGPRVVDFGIAADTTADAETDPGSAYGTPGWVAPERYHGEPATAAADVFAWGGLLVLAATGRDPFGAGTTEDLKHRVLHEEPALDGLPQQLRDLASQALAKDPAARPGALILVRELLGTPTDTEAEESEGERALAEAAARVRSLLAGAWRGIDAAGHHPAAWAAVGAVGGAAAGAALVTGAAAGGAAAGGVALGGEGSADQ
jgi:eukaryotic-like serine/threonine-protein kinase